MNDIEIAAAVGSAIRTWQQSRDFKVELSAEARGLIVRIITNIQRDPSPFWLDYEADDVQRRAIAEIPRALDSLGPGARGRLVPVVTSWEILHSISPILINVCPIRKDL